MKKKFPICEICGCTNFKFKDLCYNTKRCRDDAHLECIECGYTIFLPFGEWLMTVKEVTNEKEHSGS